MTLYINPQIRKFFGITYEQLAFLAGLCSKTKAGEEGWVTFKRDDVAFWTGLSAKASIAKIVKVLVEKGLILKLNKTSDKYTLSGALRTVISDEQEWKITYKGWSSWESLPNSTSSESELALVQKVNQASSESELDTIYTININTNNVSDINGKEEQKDSQSSAKSESEIVQRRTVTWEEKNEMKEFLKKALHRDMFEEHGAIERGQLLNHINLRTEIGKDEYELRIKKLMADEFFKKNMGSLSYALRKIRGMETQKKNSTDNSWKQVADLEIIPRNE